VTVIGGGTAGVFAAIASARTGAKTYLIEKNGMLGGTMTVANVNFPGLFFAWGKQIIDGPCWEAVKRTEALGGAVIPEISYAPVCHWHEQIRLDRFIYTCVLDEMCHESGVNILKHAMISDAVETDDNIQLLVTGKEGLILITSKIVVDATGDADLIRILGYPCIKSMPQQPATLQNHLSGYQLSEVDTGELMRRFQEKCMHGLPAYITAQTLMNYLDCAKIDIHVTCVDADTSEGKTILEYDAFKLILGVYKFLRSVHGLENIKIDFVAEETGVRETNRIVGEKTITAADYVAGISYPDAVCYAFYPIDLHVETGIEQTFLADDIVPAIPYGALIPKNSKRVLCAGRCISSDQYANSAIRVQATCMAAGQAAGCAAALSVSAGASVKDLDYRALSDALKAIGAIVPA